MNSTVPLLCACLTCLASSASQDKDPAPGAEPAISRDILSVHTVERGNMPLFGPANGSLISLDPPRAAVTFDDRAEPCEVGRSASVQIGPSPRAVSGKVIRAQAERDACEVELSGAVPTGASIGQKVGALIEVGTLTDVLFLGRPAGSAANSVATLFVLESGSSFARRSTVRYGKISGPLIQVLEGLASGDRVIVTDMSKWAMYQRVRIQ